MEAIFEFTVRNFRDPARRMGELMFNDSFQKYLEIHEGQKLVIEISPAVKTAEKERMYAFYHKVVLGSAILAFTEAGWEAVDKVKADWMLKAECARGIMYNRITGKEDIYLEDKAAMTKERLYKYISDCIHLLESVFGVTVPGSDDILGEQPGFKSVRK
jgi:hypothetical protein